MQPYSPDDINRIFQTIINQGTLEPQYAQQYGLPQTPTLSDIQSNLADHFAHLQSQQPQATPIPSSPAGQQSQDATFTPTMPAPKLMGLDEMMEMVDRKATLATQPRVEALERSLEEERLSGQQRMGDTRAAYQQSLEDVQTQTNLGQQQLSQLLSGRNMYDSGLAGMLGTQIVREGIKSGLKLGQEQARALADIAEYLDLQQRHTNEEIEAIMGEKALMAQTMLDDMRIEQQQRGDALAQQEFENWLAMQAHQLNEYWREQQFDYQQNQDEWQRWFNEEQLRLEQEQNEWERVYQMNRWEAEFELQTMLAENQISQQEFENALALDEFNLKKWLYSVQNRSYSTPTYQTVQPSEAPSSEWWDLF